MTSSADPLGPGERDPDAMWRPGGIDEMPPPAQVDWSALAAERSDDPGAGAGRGPGAARPASVVEPAEDHDRGPRRRARSATVLATAVILAITAAVAVTGVAGSWWGEDGTAVDGPRLPEAIDQRWSVSAGDVELIDAVVTTSGIVVVTDRPGPGGVEVVGLDPADGSERWRSPLDSVATSLELADGLVVISATREFAEGRFSFAVDPATGDRAWERPRDGVVLARPEMGRIGLVESGRFPASEPALEFIDLATGATVPPVGGRLVGLGIDGEVLIIDDDGAVRRADVGALAEAAEPTVPPIEATLVARTDPTHRNVVELANRYFAATDDGLVEIGPSRDVPRVVVDARPEQDRTGRLPDVTASSFFMQVGDGHAVMLGGDGAMGVELVGDEVRVRWTAPAVFELPRRVDGDRVVAEVVLRPDQWVERTPEGPAPVPVRVVDAITGEAVVDAAAPPRWRSTAAIDGVLSWRSAAGPTAAFEADTAAVAAIGLDRVRRFELVDVTAGPFVGDRVLLVERGSDAGAVWAMYDEGPRSRD